MMQISSDMQAEARMRHCGTILVPTAHAGRPFLAVKFLVVLKMVSVDDSIASTIRLQLKFTPRRANFAIRTLVFTFCVVGQ